MSRVVLACLVGAVLAISCDSGNDEKPPTVLTIGESVDALDEAYCQRLVECDCDAEYLPTQAECRAQIDGMIEQWRDEGEANGLVYDGACLGATVDALDELGCDPIDDSNDDEAPECTPECKPYHGTKGVGDPCTRWNAFDDCAQGLDCQIEDCIDECTGFCRNPCTRADVGESCDDIGCVEGADCDYETQTCRSHGSEGDSCSNVRCRDGLVCDFENDRCIELPEAGDPCFQGSCAEDAFCVVDPVDPTIQTCTAPGDLDAPCMGHRQCTSGYCPAGFCKELPGKGEECFGTCADGLVCRSDDGETSKCEEAPPAVCNANPV